jgi:hypothetical protein
MATDSDSANKGALQVRGGVGIMKNLNVGGNSTIIGNLAIATTEEDKVCGLTIGSEDTKNQGGYLDIYGAGKTRVFQVSAAGKVDIANNIDIQGNLNAFKSNGKFTIRGNSAGLTVEGQVQAKSFNAYSDARLKCNIEDYTFTKSILSLPIKQFEYIQDENHIKHIGCLAQDLEKICPQLVNTTTDGILTIQESKLVYGLIQEMKKLQERIEILERR